MISRDDALDDALARLRVLLREVDERVSPIAVDTVIGRASASGELDADDLTREMLRAAVLAADVSQGAVNPFVGTLRGIGAGRENVSLPPASELRVPSAGPATWPRGHRLDLGASAKAATADLAARGLSDAFDADVLVSLGGDLASAGGPFSVLVRDLDEDPASDIELHAGWAVATSSTQRRRWPTAELAGPHILDPWTMCPVPVLFRSVSVVAPTCVEANALSTGAVVAGTEASALLLASGRAARLVAADGSVTHVGGWPEDAEREPARGGAA